VAVVVSGVVAASVVEASLTGGLVAASLVVLGLAALVPRGLRGPLLPLLVVVGSVAVVFVAAVWLVPAFA
jgi:hypothetical protein